MRLYPFVDILHPIINAVRDLQKLCGRHPSLLRQPVQFLQCVFDRRVAQNPLPPFL